MNGQNSEKLDPKDLKRKIIAMLLAIMMVVAYPAVSFAAPDSEGETGDVSAPVDLSGMNEDTAISDELLVIVKDDTTRKELDQIAEEAGASLENMEILSDGTGLAKIGLDDPEDAQAVADDLMTEDPVLLVQPNYIYPLSDTSTTEDLRIMVNEKVIDEKMISQWYMESRYAGSSKTFDGWKGLSDSTEEVIVAVIDTGAKLDHPDIEDSIIRNKCVTFNKGRRISFTGGDGSDDDNGHGTHVCGIIASKTDDDFGISGVSDNRAKLMVIDAALPDSLGFTTQDVALAIDYAVKNGAEVINMSLGGLCRDYILEEVVDSAYANNVLCVCAAGNENSELPESPGDSAGAISVMAHNEKGKKASFSNYGSDKDVSAPGVDIVSSCISTKAASSNFVVYSQKSGTSMASPVVAGLAALIKSENKDLTARQLKNLIYTSSNNGDFSTFGFGRINTVNAVNNVHSVTEPENIVLNRSSKSMYPGESFALEYAVYPGTASLYAEEVAFTSSDPEVATVDEMGRVKATKAGAATITATCRGISATCSVSVSDITYKRIAILPYTGSGYFSPTDPTITVNYGQKSWEAMVDGYELPRTAIGKSVTVKVTSQTAIPYVRAFDPSGNEVRVSQTIMKGYSVTAKYTPTVNGRYRIQVTGGSTGGTTVHKPYVVEIKGTSLEVVDNDLSVKAKTGTVKYSKLKKKAQTLSRAKVMTVSKASGKVTYKKLSGSSKIKIDKKTGKVTVKKKTKKGRYKVRIRVSAAGDALHHPATKTVTVTVRVK